MGFFFKLEWNLKKKPLATLTSIRHTISCAKLIIIWILLCAYHFHVLSKWRCDIQKNHRVNPTEKWIWFLYEVYLNVVLAINPKLFDSQLEHGASVQFEVVFSSYFTWILARVNVCERTEFNAKVRRKLNQSKSVTSSPIDYLRKSTNFKTTFNFN